MVNIAICDDDIMTNSKIEDLLLYLGKTKHIELETDVYSDGLTLEKSIVNGTKYDLIYLDIEMKNMNGIEAAREIRKIDKDVLIIYVSGYENHMIELFEVDAFRFISKPIDAVKFESYLMKAYEKIASYSNYFEFQYMRETSKVLVGDILYFESKGRAIIIILQNGKKEKFNGKLNDVEEKLASSKIDFLRIHQSFLVNYSLIRSMSKTHVKLYDGTILQISEDRQKKISQKFCKLLGGEISD